MKVVKNKIAPPFKEAEFDIMFGEGISRVGDILDLAAGLDVVVKSGAWYAYDGSKIGQGRENAKQYLKDNPEICKAISDKVREHYGFDKAVDAVGGGNGADSSDTAVKAKDSAKTGTRAGSKGKASSKESTKTEAAENTEAKPEAEAGADTSAPAGENV